MGGGTLWARGLEHQMEMIGHQAEGMDLPIGLGAGLGQSGQEKLRVLGVAEDGFGMIATVHGVVNRSWILDTQLASHAQDIAELWECIRSGRAVFRIGNAEEKQGFCSKFPIGESLRR